MHLYLKKSTATIKNVGAHEYLRLFFSTNWGLRAHLQNWKQYILFLKQLLTDVLYKDSDKTLSLKINCSI